MAEDENKRRVREILREIKPLAAEYYRLTNKPLGVTGEVGEHIAAERLGLELAPARTAGYDAIRQTPQGPERIQIKSRACSPDTRRAQRLGVIKRGADCDVVLLVMLDDQSLEPLEMWEAPYSAVIDSLDAPGSKARERGALGVAAFKKLAKLVWPRQ